MKALLSFSFSFISIILLAEFVLRNDFVRDSLPPPKPYYSVNVENRLRKMKKMSQSIDLIFIGSSIVRTNIRPILFDYMFNNTVTSFNGGLSGLGPQSTALYLENFYLKHEKPKFVFQGIRLSELIDNDTMKRIKNSFYEKTWIENTPQHKLQNFLINNFRIAYYHGIVATTAQQFRSPIKKQEKLFKIDSRGFNATERLLTDVKNRGWIKEDRYNGTVPDPSVHPNFQAILRNAELCQKLGIKFVLINIPEHSSKYKNVPALYSKYLKTLKEFCIEKGINFVDPTAGDLDHFNDQKLFSDYHHMSPQGATKYTFMLSESLKKLQILQGSYNHYK